LGLALVFAVTRQIAVIMGTALVVLPGVSRAGDASGVPTREGAVASAAAPSFAPPPPPAYDGYQELLAFEATDALARGDYVYARHLYQVMLRIDPGDHRAAREVGRTSHALGQFERALAALRQADRLAGHAPDPELHYLIGEALFALGRDDEAEAAHALAERQLGPAPAERMPRLWLARIHARRGDIDRADALYVSLLPYSGEPDAEVSLSRAEAHILAGDWATAEKVLRDFLDQEPRHLRGRDMLAWVLEARGELAEELSLRGVTADAGRDFSRVLGHARALERSWDFAAALDRYREARALAPRRDPTLDAAIERMRYRISPELSAGLVLRGDPSGSGRELRAGAAWPVTSRTSLSLVASTETSSGEADAATSTVTAGLLVGMGRGLTSVFQASVNHLDLRREHDGAALEGGGFTLGSAVEMRTAWGSPVQAQARAELHMPWREAASTIREGGTVDGVTGHLYFLPLGPRFILDTGGQVRRITLADIGTGATPEARQVSVFAGADYVLWVDPTRTARGEILDEEMLWPAYLADALVLSYRHYEVFSRDDFGSRLMLFERAGIDELSATARKTAINGIFALELRGGGGYDRLRELSLWRAGGALLFAPIAAMRITGSFDVATESASGLVGKRHTGWVSVHVDL
jgi:tetratricopeptide (TPR) repeat protein